MISSLSFPGCSHPGLVVAPSPGFDFTGLVVWSLLAPRSWEPPSQSSPFSRSVTFWRLCGASYSPPLFPRLLRRALAYGLTVWPLPHSRWSRVVDRPLLVSSVESQLCECLFVVLPCRLVGSGVYSPASPICPTSSVLRRSSFGISASVFASSLRDGVTLPGRVCLSPRSERRLFLHLPGVWLESSRWGHPVGSLLSQISIGTKTLCAPSLVVGAKPSRWGHPFRVVWRFSAHSIGTKASSVHLSFIASRWGHPLGSGSDDLILNEGITTVGLLGAVFLASPRGVLVSSFGRPVCSVVEWVPHSVVFASGVDSVCVPLANEGVGLGPSSSGCVASRPPLGIGLLRRPRGDAFHLGVFMRWSSTHGGLASGSSGSQASRYGLLVSVQGASDSMPHSSPEGEAVASGFWHSGTGVAPGNVPSSWHGCLPGAGSVFVRLYLLRIVSLSLRFLL